MRGLLLFGGIVASAVASANLINAGFEIAPQTQGGYNADGIQGWTNASGSTGVWNIPLGGYFNTEAPEGTQIGYSNSVAVAQQSTAILGLGVTTLSIMGGRRSDNIAGSFQLQLWFGGTVAAGNVTGGTMLGSVDYIHTDYVATSFALKTITYTAVTGSAGLGQALSVRMLKLGSGQMNWDDVRLSAVVPEPSSFAVFAAAAAILGLRRRK